MKYISFCSLLTLLLFSSCQEVIILDLEESAERVIIEANLDATDSICMVQLSKSQSFYQDNNFDKIEAASISLTISNGNSYLLQELSPGNYQVNNVQISTNDSATLSITLADGTAYSASNVCPTPIQLDSLELLETEGFGGGPGSGGPGGGNTRILYQMLYNFQDVAGVLNHYRLKVWRNNELEENYIVYNDEGQDGQYIRIPFFGPPFDPGDTLDVKLMSVDQVYHDYFLQVDDIRNQGLSASVPYNPKGNFGEEVLGYFGIHHQSQLQIIAPQ